MKFARWKFVPCEETPEAICEHNLAAADAAHDLNLFGAVFLAWRTLHPSKSVQDFERLLRNKNLESHIIADTIPDIFGGKFVQPWADNREAKYNAKYSVRPREFALLELRESWPSYQANFEALKDCGLHVIPERDTEEATKTAQDHADKTGGEFVRFDDLDDAQFIEQIVACRARVQKRSDGEVLQMTNAYITKMCGEPHHFIVGMSPAGRKVMGLATTHGLWPTGYTIDPDGTVHLIKLNMNGQWST